MHVHVNVNVQSTEHGSGTLNCFKGRPFIQYSTELTVGNTRYRTSYLTQSAFEAHRKLSTPLLTHNLPPHEIKIYH